MEVKHSFAIAQAVELASVFARGLATTHDKLEPHCVGPAPLCGMFVPQVVFVGVLGTLGEGLAYPLHY